MASSQPKEKKSHDDQSEDELQQLLVSLPKDEWFNAQLCFYQGFWCPTPLLFKEVSAFQNNFEAKDTDIILASLPKSGTTWLKALLYTIVKRENLSHIAQHTLCSKNPHELILALEYHLYQNNNTPDLTDIPSPRLFATHLSYPILPESIKSSECRIVYICRNPLDNFISLCHFWTHFDIYKGNKLDMEIIEELHKYCKGVFPHGPYEENVLGYWKESIKCPQKVLFLEYEGLKKEPKVQLKRLAKFVGCPFLEEEDKDNVIDEIIELCSLKNMKEKEVNKSGKVFPWFENKALFRKGEIGDWTNYLTPSMAKGFGELQEKLSNAGFSFAYYQPNLHFKVPKEGN